jgi:hypothetical protein
MPDILLSMVKEVNHPLSTDHTLSDCSCRRSSPIWTAAHARRRSAKMESVISTYRRNETRSFGSNGKGEARAARAFLAPS